MLMISFSVFKSYDAYEQHDVNKITITTTIITTTVITTTVITTTVITTTVITYLYTPVSEK